MPERRQCEAIVDFEHFRLPGADAKKKNPLGTRKCKDGGRALELIADVFAAIGDRVEPPIRFVRRHGVFSSQNAACSATESDRTPAAFKSLIVAKSLRSGSTPPVAVSNSAAVISRRFASTTACARVISAGFGFPHCSR